MTHRSRGSGSTTDRGALGRYTPDGALGRVLLAAVAAPIAFVAFWLALVGVAAPGALGTALGLFYGALTVGGTLLALLVLWPVYLSLLGKVESAADYRGISRDDGVVERSEPDPVEICKREYAAGDLSEREFERRLETILGVEAVERARAEAGAIEAGSFEESAERSDRDGDRERVGEGTPAERRLRDRIEDRVRARLADRIRGRDAERVRSSR